MNPGCRVEGQALPLLGAGGSLTTKNPVLLTGNVTSKDGSEMLGPGLVYLDGAVTDGEGAMPPTLPPCCAPAPPPPPTMPCKQSSSSRSAVCARVQQLA